MINKYIHLVASILIVLLLSTCAMNTGKQGQAQKALLDFFGHLALGKYEAAADQYAGSYEILIEFNPTLGSEDHAALWQNGCEVNGLECLTVRSATFQGINEAGEYIFTVEFNRRGGILFELDACCGEDPTTPPQSQFVYRVVEGEDGHFLVLDMPVYVP